MSSLSGEFVVSSLYILIVPDEWYQIKTMMLSTGYKCWSTGHFKHQALRKHVKLYEICFFSCEKSSVKMYKHVARIKRFV